MRPRSARSAFTALLGLVLLSCTDSPTAVHSRLAPGGSRFDGATAPPGRIVISQIYGGGGNSNSLFRNDFVELFNAGGTAVDVTNWSVQYASSSATSNFGGTTASPLITPLSGSIPPGGYYLVQEAAGTGSQPVLPAPDASGTIAMSATSARVLVAKTTAAIGVPCPPVGGNVVDVVLYGSNSVTCGVAAP